MAKKAKPPLNDRIYNGLLKVFGPAQVTRLESERSPVKHAPVRAETGWVLRRNSNGRTYLAPAEPGRQDDFPQAGGKDH
ncbi:hypothetical protein ATJ97_2017 [Georgenia soli]|uniref:Uncharacterized protein n=1 Tax=Georgenia soli TaxID=638953 RepID=A0A2A9ELW6_9MICO|nr:hypothetical protein [Georgenia soli]PFG39511.1 hypothetical protein ATJ97_2017 [Georgenia soli]